MVMQGLFNRYTPRVASACVRFTQGFFEHGIFHGIDAVIECKSTKLQPLSGLLIIEWE